MYVCVCACVCLCVGGVGGGRAVTLLGGLDEHAPNKLRVNGPLMNFEQFAKAYGTLIKQLKASIH